VPSRHACPSSKLLRAAPRRALSLQSRHPPRLVAARASQPSLTVTSAPPLSCLRAARSSSYCRSLCASHPRVLPPSAVSSKDLPMPSARRCPDCPCSSRRRVPCPSAAPRDHRRQASSPCAAPLHPRAGLLAWRLCVLRPRAGLLAWRRCVPAPVRAAPCGVPGKPFGQGPAGMACGQPTAAGRGPRIFS
jgi:hypothetical protein